MGTRTSKRLHLETLESRRLLTTLTVTSIADSGAGSLRAVVAAANSGDDITFDAALAGQTIQLTGSQITITDDITIDGDSDGDDRADITISGNDNSRVFVVSGADVTLRSLNLTEGRIFTANGGAVAVSSTSSLALLDSTISGSGSTNGGALASSGVVTLTNVTLRDNFATSDGGAIFQNGTLTVTNGTLVGNRAEDQGGAIFNDVGGGRTGVANVIHTTLTGNVSSNHGGALYNEGTASLSRSLLAGNNSATNQGEDFFDAPTATSTTVSDTILNGNVNELFSGVVTLPLTDAIPSGAVANNGGPVDTAALHVSTSNPALDAVTPTVPTDARGVQRLLLADLGAYEYELPAVPTSLVVDTLVDEFDTDLSLGDLSLREAIGLANTSAGADTITFASPLFDTGQSLLLSMGELEINETLTITGPGQGFLSIDAQQLSRVFHFSVNTGDLTLEGLTVTGGRTTGQFENGGGIRSNSSGTVTLTHSTVSGNSTTGNLSSGGGISADSGMVSLTNSRVSDNTSQISGGGIFTFSGAVFLTNSTVSGNTSRFGGGGGIRTGSTAAVSLTHSTVSGNTSLAMGGGIYTRLGAVSLNSSTVSGNSTTGSNAAGGGISTDFGTVSLTNSTVSDNGASGQGGGIFVADSIDSPSFTVENSIVAGNTDNGTAPDLRPDPNATLTINYSLIGVADNFAQPITGNIGNQTGTATVPVDPQLGPLADNLGPTFTHALLVGSPAINAGMSSENFDQRGTPFTRNDGLGIDMGAYERQTVANLNLEVDTIADANNGDYSPGDLSLREAIGLANTSAGADTITFASPLFDTGQSLLLNMGELEIAETLTITGPGQGFLSIDAQQRSRVFHFSVNTGDLTLEGLTVTGGRTTGQFEDGGGIHSNSSGTVTLNHSTVSGNSTTGANADGGGIGTYSGAVSLLNSTVSGNSTTGASANGGGISTFLRPVSLTNSTVSGNSVTGSSANGGGIWTSANGGSLTNSTVSANGASSAGGGIYVFFLGNPSFTVENSIVAGNTDNGTAPDLRPAPDGTLTINYSLIGVADNIAPPITGNVGNQTGTAAVPLDPQLGPLANHGGPTFTHALLPGSHAINAGDPNFDPNVFAPPLVNDQRGAGFDRVNGGRIDVGAYERQSAAVAARHVFYENSAFDDPDGNGPLTGAGVHASDDLAIADDKQALLPGQTATFANYTSSSRGINGIMIDIADLPTTSLTVADFEFAVGNDDTPDTWAALPTSLLERVQVVVRSGAGVNNSDRVTILLPDGEVQKQWLEVTVLSNTNTGLAEPDVHYWGNAVGDGGDSTVNSIVNATDEIDARNNPHTSFRNPALIDDPYDYNRDARVNATDEIIARNNPTSFRSDLNLITPNPGQGGTLLAMTADSVEAIFAPISSPPTLSTHLPAHHRGIPSSRTAFATDLVLQRLNYAANQTQTPSNEVDVPVPTVLAEDSETAAIDRLLESNELFEAYPFVSFGERWSR